ncbi:mannose-specific lectin-like [Parambassis ranga]|uniref:Mannose-specific lectin-like n=1 Tax=Parambassis ranga TaxID=210632 RepID=A0A6P7KH66_9TELE|nr:mannose-specific lectin-like [Parambassis ranga]
MFPPCCCLGGVRRPSLIMSRNFLSKNDELRRGDYLLSNNGEWKAVFQDDGNFVIYGWSPKWASDTANSDAVRLCMQADCNLVMYNIDSQPRWHTKTNKGNCNMCRLYLTNDGKLVLNRECEQIWSSNDSKGMK